MNDYLMNVNKNAWSTFCNKINLLPLNQLKVSSFNWKHHSLTSIAHYDVIIHVYLTEQDTSSAPIATLIFQDGSTSRMKDVYDSLKQLILTGLHTESDFISALRPIYPECFYNSR